MDSLLVLILGWCVGVSLNLSGRVRGSLFRAWCPIVHSWREICFGKSTPCSTFSALGSVRSLIWSNSFACFLSAKLSPSTHHLLHLQNKICKKKGTTSFWTLGNLVRPSNVPKFCIIAPPSPRRQDIKFHLQSIGGCNQISHFPKCHMIEVYWVSVREWVSKQTNQVLISVKLLNTVWSNGTGIGQRKNLKRYPLLKFQDIY